MLNRPLLAVDVGSTLTKVGLVASVDGANRLVCDVAGRTRVGHPDGGGPAGFLDLLRTIENLTGCVLLDARGQIEQSNFPPVAISTSCAPLLPVVILAGSIESLDVLRDLIVNVGFTRVTAQAALRNPGREPDRGLEILLERLDGVEAGVVVVAPRSRRDASSMGAILGAVRLSASDRRIPVLFAGAKNLSESLATAIPDSMDLHHIVTTDWLEPAFDSTQLRAVLGSMERPSNEMVESITRTLPAGSIGAVEATPGVTNRMITALARAVEGSVGVVDVGGRTTSIMVATPADEKKQSRSGPLRLDSRAVLGTGAGLGHVLRRLDLHRIKSWLPFDVEDGTLLDHLGNRWRRAQTVLGDVRELLVEQAVARECARAVMPSEAGTKLDILIATGGMAAYPRIGQSVLTLLDIFQPVRPCRLLLDRSSLLPRLAAVSRVDPLAAVSVLRTDTFVNAGPCLSLAGRANEGDVVAEIGVQRQVGPDEEPRSSRSYEIRYGTITAIPLRSDERAAIRVAAAKRMSFEIDKNRRVWSSTLGEAAPTANDSVSGGLLGLIIDARGRPLELPQDRLVRQAQLAEWLQALDAVDPPDLSGLN